MGKVGSTSIYDALSEVNIKPIQLHVLDADRNDRIVQEHQQRGFAIPEHILDARRVQSLIANPDEKFRIISLVRDPVARNLSALFESWDVYPPAYNEVEGPAKLAEWFVMNFDYSVLGWFDQEIKAQTGIDVYAHPFDHESKRLIIETNNIKMLVLRSEDSQEEKEKSLEAFLEVPKVTLGFTNSSEGKPTAELWRTMKRNAKVSSILAGIVYSSKLVRHFYTMEEADAFQQVWTPSQDGIYFEDSR
jgi:hypothetical protein